MNKYAGVVVLWQSTLLWVEAFKAIFAKQKCCTTIDTDKIMFAG